jgi:hypothetical protein
MIRVQQFDYSAQIDPALLWHYNKAKRLESLVLQKQLWYDINQKLFWEDWYRDVFNLLTANDFGLAVWAIILGLPIFLTIHAEDDGPVFGFGPDDDNFDNGPFGHKTGVTSKLTREEIRIILRLRYCQLTSRGDIPTTNRQLNMIFGNHNRVYVLDGLDMSITCVFLFFPSTRLLRAIRDFDLIPRSDGVLINYVLDTGDIFGFGPDNVNFDNGIFSPLD